MEFKSSLHKDFNRYKKDIPTNYNIVKLFFSKVGFRAIVLYRISRFFILTKRFLFIPGICMRLMRHLCHCYISPNSIIGPGFLIAHVGGIVIGSGTDIGENCDIRQNVTFGGNYNKKNEYGRTKPKLGNNVSIGVGAVIIGPVEIGDNVIIGANSVVIRDIPSDTIAAGNPARIIKRKWDESTGRKL